MYFYNFINKLFMSFNQLKARNFSLKAQKN